MPAATLISAVPTFVSPEEHSALVASTPVSFSDIPPVLRHKEDNVAVTFDPALPGFAPADGAQGTLYVVERCAQRDCMSCMLDEHLIRC